MSLDDDIRRLVRPQVQALKAYHVPDPGSMIKLDAMENPFTLPESLRADLAARLAAVDLNRYPDPTAGGLQARLRQVMQVPADAGICLGNGSDELIQMIIQAVAMPGRVIMAPEPTFVMYRQIASVAGLDFVGVPLADDFSLQADRLLDAIAASDPAVIFLAYPNNPTGNLFDAAVIEQALAASNGLVVVDEAYAPFTDASFMPLLDRYSNLLVLRTVSKMGLAGLRLGMLAGAPAWIEQIDKTRLPYNISALNQAAGSFALENAALFAEQAAAIRAQRGVLLEQLAALPGLTVYPSEANFILFRAPQGQAGVLFEGLKSAGILIKNLDGSSPALRDCLRVTVGLAGENAAFIAALSALLEN